MNVLQDFARRYAAKYVVTGSFTPVYHFMGILGVSMYALKWNVATKYKISQRKEELAEAMDYYKAHHAHHGDGHH